MKYNYFCLILLSFFVLFIVFYEDLNLLELLIYMVKGYLLINVRKCNDIGEF